MAASWYNGGMRKLLFPLLLLLGVLFIISRLAELETIGRTLRQANPRYLVLAFGVQMLWFLNAGLNLRWIYRALGLKESLLRLTLLSVAASFTNVVAPAGGMTGMAVYVSEAQRQRYSPVRATVAGMLYFWSEYVGFLAVLALGIIVLIRRNNLHTPEIVASALMGLLVFGLGTLLYLGMHSARQLGAVLAFAARAINAVLRPFLHRPYLSEERAHHFAHDAQAGLRTLGQKPKIMLVPLLLGLTSKLLLLLVLLLSFRAYQVPYSPGTIVAGFSIAYLFLIISPTPSGIGVVEGLLTVGLNSMYVPLGQAAIVALTYRAVTFWVPLLLGPAAFRLLDHLPGPGPTLSR
ncbi:MAG TPA: flippase-like domain-containing protein [Anaerolineaceae bacterium]|nr:flippase-like domain-containing protein [Anaerolineales bacterium]HIQ08344.1 flippase-like domain-containing protein [Anaerolineaceae bacterium]